MSFFRCRLRIKDRFRTPVLYNWYLASHPIGPFPISLTYSIVTPAVWSITLAALSSYTDLFNLSDLKTLKILLFFQKCFRFFPENVSVFFSLFPVFSRLFPEWFRNKAEKTPETDRKKAETFSGKRAESFQFYGQDNDSYLFEGFWWPLPSFVH